MATLSFEPASEFYGEPIPCEVRTCSSLADVRVEQEHMDDGESWPMCRTHAVEAAAEQMEWVANDGEVPDPVAAAGPVGVPAEQPEPALARCKHFEVSSHDYEYDGQPLWCPGPVAEPLVADPTQEQR